MKKILLLIIITLSVYGEKIESVFPVIDKVQNVAPWWMNESSPVEGMIGGIGEAISKDKKARTIAMEGARREIAASKQTVIEANFNLKQDSSGQTSANLQSQQIIKGEVKAVLIDTWDNGEKLYVWMGEFLDEASQEKLKNYINQKNQETMENRIQIAKYAGKIVVTNKDAGRITLNAGKDKKVKKGEVYNIYRLKSESVNPLNNEVEDFSSKKIGEIVIIDVLDKSSTGKASFIDNVKINVGDIASPAGISYEENKQKKISLREEKMKKYDYDLYYVPKVLNIERAKPLSTRQYSVSAYTDFDNHTVDLRMGLFRFFEVSAMGTNGEFDNYMTFFGKVGIPVTEELYIGLGYETTVSENEDYIVTLLEYIFMDKAGLVSFNYKYPVESNPNDGFIGASAQYKLSNSVVFGLEVGKVLETASENYFTLKGNLEIMDDVWLSGGVTWEEDDEKKYFVKIEHLNII